MNYARRARNLRRTSIVFFALAGAFATGGIVLFIASGEFLAIATLFGPIIIATSGMSLRNTASGYDDMARRYGH